MVRKEAGQGIQIWRRIVDTIIDEINRGVLTVGTRLPPAPELADRFGVNRLTVLRALNHLSGEGLVSMEQGRGTFVRGNVINYRFGNRSYFEENILENHKKPTRRLIGIEEMDATLPIATALELAEGTPVLVVTIRSEADGLPICYGPSYFTFPDLPKLAAAFEKASKGGDTVFSTTAVLKKLGITDHHRKSIRMRTRMPTIAEVDQLGIPTGEPVTQTDVVNVDGEGKPVSLGQVVYATSRVEFVFET
ncbi:phosphonate metabolism transcriptional regulator PhnF [Agrobacterium tumefaciens]|uniref:phosphonate metabolism transcriptional regulator PhnF n=1 Tax=Agrobacterium tumefaciens TaxID=358 RepID=UPI0015740E7B|nr:phosphonate metabolism transcriptional regulator PhnF [Agrobacterium tumefaciens]NTE66240.1 phosphonate metabolism transcriptional regulator PhnF [Agrobacterium tumefaciens]